MTDPSFFFILTSPVKTSPWLIAAYPFPGFLITLSVRVQQLSVLTLDFLERVAEYI